MAREFSKSFYRSKEWKIVREYCLLRDNYLCIRCGEPAEEVHHKIHLSPKNINDISITLNPDNLICLCKDCHFEQHKIDYAASVARANKRRMHKRIVNTDGTYMDDNGLLQMRKIYIIYGSPRAGKNTYVDEHKEYGDVVIDMDAIISALQGNQQRHKDNNLKFLAMGVIEYLYSKLEEKHKDFDCKNVWIIGGFPIKEEREKLAERLKATLIYIDCDYDTAIERAKKTNLYDNDIQYSIDVVNEYWNKLQL